MDSTVIVRGEITIHHVLSVPKNYSTGTYIKSEIKKPTQRKGIVVSSTPALKSQSINDPYHIKQNQQM